MAAKNKSVGVSEKTRVVKADPVVKTEKVVAEGSSKEGETTGGQEAVKTGGDGIEKKIGTASKHAIGSAPEKPANKGSASSVQATVQSTVSSQVAAPVKTKEPVPSSRATNDKPASDVDEDEEVPLEKRNKRIYIVGIVISVLIVIATVGLFYLRLSQTGGEIEEVVVDVGVIEEDSEVDATPIPLGREDVTLDVMNASGVAGLAGETAEIFEELGYEILEIGNAEETGGNQLYIDPDLEGQLGVLLEDVEEELEISSVSGDLVDSDASARIILGK